MFTEEMDKIVREHCLNWIAGTLAMETTAEELSSSYADDLDREAILDLAGVTEEDIENEAESYLAIKAEIERRSTAVLDEVREMIEGLIEKKQDQPRYDWFETPIWTPDPPDVDSIQIPDRFVELAKGWYDGQTSMLYAIASTGNLTRGDIRPSWGGRPATDREWYYSLWRDLSCELGGLIRSLKKKYDDETIAELSNLPEFETWVDEVAERLFQQYELVDPDDYEV